MSDRWRDRFADKAADAEQAIRRIRAGDRVFIGTACGEPQELVRALVAAAGRLTDVELLQVMKLGEATYADPIYSASFRPNAFFIGQSLRDPVNDARADYTPVLLSQAPDLFRSGRIAIDAALISVTPPDSHGLCSLGASVDITKAAAESARLVIAQVNDQMPRALGDCFLHVSQIDYLVEHSEPLPEPPAPDEPDDVTLRIAENIARLVPDGATLQLGVGRLPDAVLALLDKKTDLGVHTEMFSDGVMRLAEKGVVTGRRKTLQRGKIVASFAVGSRELFDFLHDNPLVEMHPTEFTNSPFVISQQENIVAINSAIEVDLTGQVAADSVGSRLYSGIGGQADFVRGAAMAKGGRPIIALPSTAKSADGPRSRIVAALAEGAGVTTTRGDTRYVVTEFGVAYLHGRNLRERAMSLINIAHPDFRSELLHKAKRRRLVYANQILPPARFPYPQQYESSVTLKDGATVFLRPIRPDDEPLIKDMFYSFSERTRYLRFHGPVQALPHSRLQVFCNIDYSEEMAIIGVIGEPGDEEVIAVGRYTHEPAENRAEVAFVVRDDWQNRGLGRALFSKLVEIGRQRGIRQFWAEVLAENFAMLKVFHHSDCAVATSTEGEVVRVTIDLQPAAGASPSTRNAHNAKS